MCFIVDPTLADPFIAQNDITCYKLVKCHSFDPKKFISLFESFVYELDAINPVVLLFKCRDMDMDYYIDEGYHSYQSPPALESDNYYVIVSCIIPKGSTYYYNRTNEYVSSNIIIKSIHK